MPDNPIQLERLLATLMVSNAESLILTAGRSPRLILKGHECELQARPLRAEDIAAYVHQLSDSEDKRSQWMVQVEDDDITVELSANVRRVGNSVELELHRTGPIVRSASRRRRSELSENNN